MSVRKIGRKARALAKTKAAERFIEQERQHVTRKQRRLEIAVFIASNPQVSTRVVERRFHMHRDRITNLREEIGFVVPKKDYRCFKRHNDFSWPKQPGEKPGICACGCGGKTNQTTNNNYQTGMKAGDFFRFIHGHQWLLRRRILKPKGWRSSHELNQERDRLRATLVTAAAKLPRYTSGKVGTFEDLRNRLKKIELDGHTVVDQQVSRMINIGRRYLREGDKVPTLIHANSATKVEWLERLVTVSASMGAASIEITELRRRMNEPMLMPNPAISRFLNVQRLSNPAIPFVHFPLKEKERIAPVEPITEHYPFGGEDDLLQFILSIVPTTYCSDARGDIAQDMALAVISGQCEREQLKDNLGRFITGYYKKYSAGRSNNMISLDAPVRMGDGGSVNLHELIGAESGIMTEFLGGKNYETQQTYFERPEQLDGEICARY